MVAGLAERVERGAPHRRVLVPRRPRDGAEGPRVAERPERRDREAPDLRLGVSQRVRDRLERLGAPDARERFDGGHAHGV